MEQNLDNFGSPYKYPGANSEYVCMECGYKWYTPNILGDDNVFRTLPSHCRQCEAQMKLKTPTRA